MIGLITMFSVELPNSWFRRIVIHLADSVVTVYVRSPINLPKLLGKMFYLVDSDLIWETITSQDPEHHHFLHCCGSANYQQHFHFKFPGGIDKSVLEKIFAAFDLLKFQTKADATFISRLLYPTFPTIIDTTDKDKFFTLFDEYMKTKMDMRYPIVPSANEQWISSFSNSFSVFFVVDLFSHILKILSKKLKLEKLTETIALGALWSLSFLITGNWRFALTSMLMYATLRTTGIRHQGALMVVIALVGRVIADASQFDKNFHELPNLYSTVGGNVAGFIGAKAVSYPIKKLLDHMTGHEEEKNKLKPFQPT